mmetsp:Transcript_10304/g.28966  ORF Transcript_10304/g.28966 Transcript_10304/m.28966 type:complete len:206 (+) Transcript_10304:61-678(+)
MSVPTPTVKPAMTDTGTSLATTPTRVTPDASCKPPVARVMKGSASNPWAWTAPTTSRLMAAAGPVTARVVPPKSPPAMPDTAAVTSPTSAGTPLARAMARESGTAMQPTVTPADMSVRRVDELNIFFHSGTRDGMPRFRSRGFLLVFFVGASFSSAFSSSAFLLLPVERKRNCCCFRAGKGASIIRSTQDVPPPPPSSDDAAATA